MEKKTKFSLKNTKNHVDFAAIVEDHNLHPGILDALNHEVDPEYAEELEVTGEFSVEWDGQKPYVTIEGLGVAAGNEYFEISVDDDNFDFDDLIEQIEMDENVNYNEYMAGYEDYLADLAMDR